MTARLDGAASLAGDLLVVHLGSGRSERRPLPPVAIEHVLAGRGLTARELFRRLNPAVDPRGRSNPLIVACGLLTGTRVPTSVRTHLGARSPLTRLAGSSNVGGTVGTALRSNGVQMLIVEGRAEHPVFLHIGAQGVSVHDARELWGQETQDATETLLAAVEDHERPPAVLVIGPAGERGSALACVMTQGGHAAGRTGMGAVMGAKRLKAIVIEQRRQRPIGLPSRDAVRDYLRAIRAAAQFEELRRHGSSSAVAWCDELGMLATRNYRQARFEGAQAIDGTALDRAVERRHGCPRCPIGCKASLRLEGDRYAGVAARPDFEPLVAWGSKCGLADVQAVVHLHNRCDGLGIDSVSGGSTVSYAIELSELGLLADRRGPRLAWGDAEAMEALLEEMAARRGLGDLFADGVRAAGERLGPAAERYAHHVKGLELTAYDPRAAAATALGYAVSARGGDFTAVYARHEYSLSADRAAALYGDPAAADRLAPQAKPEMVRRSMVVSAVLDALGLCKVPALSLLNEYDLRHEAELLGTVAGVTVEPKALFAAGERIVALERLTNLRLGAGAGDDCLPVTFTAEAAGEAPASGPAAHVTPMVREFYRRMGWDEEGVPESGTLDRLGLSSTVAPASPHPAHERSAT